VDVRPITASVSIPREIHEIERRTAAARHPVDVGQPRLARRRARTRDTLADERINQARFADVGAPDERDFRRAVVRQIGCRRGARHELSDYLQWVIVSSTMSTGA